MRFHRMERWGEFNDTRRKRLALDRKLRLEREALPLFADAIAGEQAKTSPDQIMQARAEAWADGEREWRQRRADNWRRARAKLRTYSDNVRPALLAYWNRCKWPHDPVYLLSMMHMFDTGRLNLEGPTGPESWKP